MKTRIIILLSALAISLTTTALAQDFNTGSALMNTGSNYTSTVYGVGATGINPMATTTSYGPIRRTTGSDDDEESGLGDVGDYTPIGAPYIMLLFAAAAAGVIALRRRKSVES